MTVAIPALGQTQVAQSVLLSGTEAMFTIARVMCRAPICNYLTEDCWVLQTIDYCTCTAEVFELLLFPRPRT